MPRWKRLNLWENTIVVLASDHGFHLGDHGGLWAKLTNFERSARVPFAIVAPGMKRRGEATRGIVELLDIYPTLIDLCGLPRPGHLEGRSLKPLLDDPRARWDGRAYTATIHGDGIIGRSVRTEHFRYTEWDHGRVGTELYNHRSDAGEYDNLAMSRAKAGDVAAQKIVLSRIPKFSGPIPKDPQSPRGVPATR